MAKRGNQPRHPVLRGDYQPPAWRVEEVILEFRLDREDTRVTAVLQVHRNPDGNSPRAPLTLKGEDLKTHSVSVDGVAVPEKKLRNDGSELVIADVPDTAEVRTEVSINPADNSALEGLYASGAMLLTQCEAEGFRKITWFPDRPDIMARYKVRLEGDKTLYPVLLSNGNLVDHGDLDGGRHYAVWHDPYPKPSYLFALVAGDLGQVTDRFVTGSGREVMLKIYSERGNLHQLDHAMACLKHAMAWDEQRFGLEYDLDVFHIVATHDFNMGAMENKSLNIFNARYVLADPDTATDADYQAIEGVIGHEYFHNWTGNRVTCRDWFQLTLKEGLTVFRDQEFSADMQSRPVKRIEDVRSLRQRQFPEDAGPMAHPVRPERYLEISNFYTATIYEKGAEVVRMYQTLLGRDGFRDGLDLYFERHDGEAVTCDDFLAAMADANGRDLSRFARWYRQVGTPRLRVTSSWDADAGVFELTFRQSLIDYADNTEIGPLMIPVIMGLIGGDGASVPVTLDGESEPGPTDRLVVINEAEQTLRFIGLEERPLPSLLRGYSAPVILEYDYSDKDLARLLAHDDDALARWDAGRRLAERALVAAVDEYARNGEIIAPDLLITAWRRVIADDDLDPALAGELLQLPAETELAEVVKPVDVDVIRGARVAIRRALSRELSETVEARLAALNDGRADTSGQRRLRNTLLSLKAAGPVAGIFEYLADRYHESVNMTDRLAALATLVHHDAGQADAVLVDFESRYRDNPLVMDKWFAVQATRPGAATLERVAFLMDHDAFNLKNPNKVRSLIGAFAASNPTGFHRADGRGYTFVADRILELDRLNPQVAARIAGVFNRWTRYPTERKRLMKAELERIAGTKGLSPDVTEIVTAALKQRG